MSMAPFPSARTMQRALAVIVQLPLEAQADLAAHIIDRLDAAGPDPDLEAEADCCEAGECGGVVPPTDWNAGDAADAEPDDDDMESSPDEEPMFHGEPRRGLPEPVRYIERAGWTGPKRGEWAFVERVRT